MTPVDVTELCWLAEADMDVSPSFFFFYLVFDVLYSFSILASDHLLNLYHGQSDQTM